ncbi:ABC transporter permease [Chloroflexota bacterium]
MRDIKHSWFITMKDLKLFVMDRGALFFFILFPFLFIALFSVILGSAESEDERFELHLVTLEDRGSLSHRILESIETDDEADLDSGELLIIWDKDYNEALQAVYNHELDGFITFPEDFTDGVIMGYGTDLEVTINPEATYTRAALNSVADTITYQFGLQQVAGDAVSELLLERWLDSPGNSSRIGQEIQKLLSVQWGIRMRPSLLEYDVANIGEVEAENPSNYVVPGYLVMFVFMAAAFSAEAIVRERQNHTLERLLTTSVNRRAILSGLFFSTVTKGFIQIVLFWVVGILVFRIDMGISPIAVVLLSLMMVVMSSAFAIMLATLAKTQRSAGSIALISSLVLAPLGGCWWPLFITPRWMQSLAKITPHGWATTGFNKLLVFSADFNSVIPEMLALMGFAVIFGIVALWRFRTSAT